VKDRVWHVLTRVLRIDHQLRAHETRRHFQEVQQPIEIRRRGSRRRGVAGVKRVEEVQQVIERHRLGVVAAPGRIRGNRTQRPIRVQGKRQRELPAQPGRVAGRYQQDLERAGKGPVVPRQPGERQGIARARIGRHTPVHLLHKHRERGHRRRPRHPVSLVHEPQRLPAVQDDRVRALAQAVPEVQRRDVLVIGVGRIGGHPAPEVGSHVAGRVLRRATLPRAKTHVLGGVRVAVIRVPVLGLAQPARRPWRLPVRAIEHGQVHRAPVHGQVGVVVGLGRAGLVGARRVGKALEKDALVLPRRLRAEQAFLAQRPAVVERAVECRLGVAAIREVDIGLHHAAVLGIGVERLRIVGVHARDRLGNADPDPVAQARRQTRPEVRGCRIRAPRGRRIMRHEDSDGRFDRGGRARIVVRPVVVDQARGSQADLVRRGLSQGRGAADRVDATRTHQAVAAAGDERGVGRVDPVVVDAFGIAVPRGRKRRQPDDAVDVDLRHVRPVEQAEVAADLRVGLLLTRLDRAGVRVVSHAIQHVVARRADPACADHHAPHRVLLAAAVRRRQTRHVQRPLPAAVHVQFARGHRVGRVARAVELEIRGAARDERLIEVQVRGIPAPVVIRPSLARAVVGRIRHAPIVPGARLREEQLRGLAAPDQAPLRVRVVGAAQHAIHVPAVERVGVVLEGRHDRVRVAEIDDVDRPLSDPPGGQLALLRGEQSAFARRGEQKGVVRKIIPCVGEQHAEHVEVPGQQMAGHRLIACVDRSIVVRVQPVGQPEYERPRQAGENALPARFEGRLGRLVNNRVVGSAAVAPVAQGPVHVQAPVRENVPGEHSGNVVRNRSLLCGVEREREPVSQDQTLSQQLHKAAHAPVAAYVGRDAQRPRRHRHVGALRGHLGAPSGQGGGQREQATGELRRVEVIAAQQALELAGCEGVVGRLAQGAPGPRATPREVDLVGAVGDLRGPPALRSAVKRGGPPVQGLARIVEPHRAPAPEVRRVAERRQLGWVNQGAGEDIGVVIRELEELDAAQTVDGIRDSGLGARGRGRSEQFAVPPLDARARIAAQQLGYFVRREHGQ